MLNFYRFRPVDYIVEEQLDCIPEETESCVGEPQYIMPAKAEDDVKMIVDKAELGGFDSSVLRIGISSCGVLLYPDVADIEIIENQAFITITIPEDIEEGCYEYLVYADVDPIDCSELYGATVGDLCNYTVAQLCNCTFIDIGCDLVPPEGIFGPEFDNTFN